MIITRSERIMWIGDSISAGFGAGTCPLPLITGPAIASFYGTPPVPPVTAHVLPPARNRPVMSVDAVAGRACANIAVDAPTFQTFLSPYRQASAAIVQLGVNDAANISTASLLLSDFVLQSLIIVNGLNSLWGVPYSKILWVGPWAHDSGDIAAFIAQVEGALATNAASRGFQLVRMSSIPNTGGNSIADGTHPTVQGATALTAQLMGAIQLAA